MPALLLVLPQAAVQGLGCSSHFDVILVDLQNFSFFKPSSQPTLPLSSHSSGLRKDLVSSLYHCCSSALWQSVFPSQARTYTQLSPPWLDQILIGAINLGWVSDKMPSMLSRLRMLEVLGFYKASLLRDGNELTLCLTDIQQWERQDTQIKSREKYTCKNMRESCIFKFRVISGGVCTI